MDRAIVGLLNDEDHREDSWGLRRDVQKGYRDKAPICCACAGDVLSVTLLDITVVGGNLLGWLLVMAPRCLQTRSFFQDLSRRETRMRQW
jgi:hypothetical protein